MTHASTTSSVHDPASIDWPHWLARWDVQQTGYLPEREARFNAMLDALDVLLPESFVALDLACGPGAISQRLLARFPQARSIAVDLDPILLTMGRNVLGDMDGRLTWVETDLASPTWPSQLGVDSVDAVLSTTALHWLPAPNLVDLYRQLGQLVRPGGVFLNGDHMSFEPRLARFQQVANVVKKRIQDEAFTQARRRRLGSLVERAGARTRSRGLDGRTRTAICATAPQRLNVCAPPHLRPTRSGAARCRIRAGRRHLATFRQPRAHGNPLGQISSHSIHEVLCCGLTDDRFNAPPSEQYACG